MKIITLTILILLISGCNKEASDKLDRERGIARHNMFIECMELSAKITRKGDDDVSDIISECDNVGYYTANQILK